MWVYPCAVCRALSSPSLRGFSPALSADQRLAGSVPDFVEMGGEKDKLCTRKPERVTAQPALVPWDSCAVQQMRSAVQTARRKYSCKRHPADHGVARVFPPRWLLSAPEAGHPLLQSLMRALLVVVLDELPEHVFQMTLPKDEQVVEELAACRGHKSFSE